MVWDERMEEGRELLIVGSAIRSERNRKQISARNVKTGGRGWSQCTERNILRSFARLDGVI